MKKIVSLMLVLSLVLSMNMTYANKYFESDYVSLTNPLTGVSGDYYPVNLMMGGQDMITDAPGILYVSGTSTRTLVPISFIVDSMGAQIAWKQETREITIVNGSTTIVMQIDNAYATVNGKKTKLPDGIAPILLQYGDLNKTYVPVKFISDQLGLDVNWISDTRTVAINKKAQTLTDIDLNYMAQFPEIRLKVSGEVDATSFNISGSDVGEQDKIVVDFQNTKFDLKDKSMLKNGVGTYDIFDGIFGIDKVEITSTSSNPPTTRVTVYLDEKKGHDVYYDKKTGEMVIQLINTVNEVGYEQMFGTDAVVIETSELPNYNVNIVGDQVIVDVFNAYLKANDGQSTYVPVSKGKVASVAYNQLDTSAYSYEDIYTPDDVITRVSIELNEDIDYDELYIEPDGTNIIVYVSQNPLNNFDYVKASPSKGNLNIRLFNEANYQSNYNASTHVLTVTVPKEATDLNAFDYPINDQIVESVEISESGSNYIVNIKLEDNTTYQKQVIDNTIAITFVNETILNSDYKDMLIVIDPGHGGHDSGASGSQSKEKDLALSASLKLQDQLKQLGFKVYMTRSTDEYIGLYERADIANDLNATLFVSVHINAATNTAAKGVEVLYAGDSMKTGKGFAAAIQPYLVKDLSAVNRGTVYRPNLVVLRETKMPSVLCELGFISNPEEQQKMMTSEYQDKAAAAIVKGILDFID